MNTFLIILFIIIVSIILIAIYYIHLVNKITESIIRIDEAEARIDTDLRNKYDTLNKSITLAKSLVKVENNKFRDIVRLRSRRMSNFSLDRVLVDIYNEFLVLYDSNKKLHDNDEIFNNMKHLAVIDEELETLRDYYNANITNYNTMVKKFPTSIVAKIKKYRERLFYDLKDMSDEDYEDFKL